MHQLQKTLLKRLFLKNSQRYGSLTDGYDFEDNVVFHLKELISKGYVSKSNGVYTITNSGIKEIAKYEPIELEDRGVKTFFIGFLCSDDNDNYLLKSHPQAKTNFYNLPSGKPYFGENIDIALSRTFNQNTGLQLEVSRFKFTSLHLKIIQTADNEVIFDDAFCIYNVEFTPEEKGQMNLHDQINWYSLKQIQSLSQKWPEVDICILNKDLYPYKSYRYISDYIL